MYGMNGLNSFQGGFSPGIQDVEQAFLQSNAAQSLPGMAPQQTEVDEMSSGVGGQDKMMEFMKMMSGSGGDDGSVAGNMAKLAMMFI